MQERPCSLGAHHPPSTLMCSPTCRLSQPCCLEVGRGLWRLHYAGVIDYIIGHWWLNSLLAPFQRWGVGWKVLTLNTGLFQRRKWNLTPVFLPGESHGQRSLASYCVYLNINSSEKILGKCILVEPQLNASNISFNPCYYYGIIKIWKLMLWLPLSNEHICTCAKNNNMTW